MSTQIEIEIKPLDVIIEGDARASLGAAAQEALRRQTIRELDEAQKACERAADALPQLNGPDAREALELYSGALEAARNAVNILWWLAPDADAAP